MLFSLHDSLLEKLQKDDVDRDLIQVLEELARSRQYGDHLIIDSRDLLKQLINLPSLPVKSRDLYLAVSEELIQLKSLTLLLKRKIEITNHSSTQLSTSSDGFLTLYVPYKQFTHYIFNKTILLGENLIDSKIYCEIAKTYLAMVKFEGLNLNFEPRGGGGNTISKEYAEIQESKERLCICLVDSDRKHPTATCGLTAKGVEEIDNPEVLFCEVTIIEPRDIENLFPSQILKEIVQQTDQQGLITILESMDACEIDPSARNYLDIKKGIKLGEILHSSNNLDFYNYWQTILSRHRLSQNIACNDEPNCNNPKQCTCIISNGLGDNISDKFYNYIEFKTSQKIAETVSSIKHLSANWEAIGEVVVAWGCGGEMIQLATSGNGK